MTVNVPLSADDADYPMPLDFNAYDGDNNNHPFSYNIQTIMVDKSVPDVPTFSVSPKSTSIYVSSWQSFDSRSNGYTIVNQGSGISGIKNYNVTVLYGSTVKGNKDFKPSDAHYYTFGGLQSNTSHTITVTATDMAGNVRSAQKTTLTAPAAPTVSLSKASYCYINLTWTASGGATGYELYNATNPMTPVLITTTTSTSFSVSQSITHGTAYKFFVKALNGTLKSDAGNTLTVSTPSLPTPVISGGQSVCSSGSTFTVSNLPTSDCSLTWNKGAYLSLYSSSGNSATFKATGSGVTYVKAIYTASCISTSKNLTVDAGTPNPGPITIYWDAPPQRFTASIDGVASATSYKWYLNGVLMYNNLNDAVIFTRHVSQCDYRYDVDVYTVNTCGTSTRSHAEAYEEPCYENFTIYPNPASSEITIAQNEELSSVTLEKKEPKTIKSYRIMDNSGIIYMDKSFDISTNSTTINISNLKTGTYMIIINSGFEEESYTLIKN